MASITGSVVDIPSRRVLIGVTVALGLCAVGGLGFGVLQGLPHKAAAADEETPIAGHVPAGAVIKDAQPIAEPPPPLAKPKAAKSDDDTADGAAGSDAPPLSKSPTATAPAEAAPGAPPSLAPVSPTPPSSAPPGPVKLPDDLPPT